jgi:hypothetical protein
MSDVASSGGFVAGGLSAQRVPGEATVAERTGTNEATARFDHVVAALQRGYGHPPPATVGKSALSFSATCFVARKCVKCMDRFTRFIGTL